MRNVLNSGSFMELSELEKVETQGGCGIIVATAVICGIVAIFEFTSQAVNYCNKQTAQTNANNSGQPCTVNLIGPGVTLGALWCGDEKPTYTAYPN